MDNMAGERLKQLRSELNIKQGEFAKKISTTQGHISDIENGRKELSDRTIKLIELEFNVNGNWLRTGDGEIFNSITEDEELAYEMGKILSNDDEFVKRTMLTLSKLDASEWALIKKIVTSIKSDTE